MDKKRLEKEIKNKGYTVGSLCIAIGMSRSAFYRKCNGISDFTLTEVKKIVEVLQLETPENIFFADKVS